MQCDSTESSTPLGVQIIVGLLALVAGLLLGAFVLGVFLGVLIAPLFLIIPVPDALLGFLDTAIPYWYWSLLLGSSFAGLAATVDAATNEAVREWYSYLKATVVGTEPSNPLDREFVTFDLYRATARATATSAFTAWAVAQYVLGCNAFFVGLAYAFYIALFGAVLCVLVTVKVPIYDWIVVGWLKLTHPRSLFQKRKARNRTKSHQ